MYFQELQPCLELCLHIAKLTIVHFGRYLITINTKAQIAYKFEHVHSYKMVLLLQKTAWLSKMPSLIASFVDCDKYFGSTVLPLDKTGSGYCVITPCS